MSVINELLKNIEIPRMLKIKQFFSNCTINDVENKLNEKLNDIDVLRNIKKGVKIAVAVGSRGVRDIDIITKTVINDLKNRGLEPFIIPAMGSHGGATAEGQKDVLRELNITEDNMGCPIKSSMEVVKIGKIDNSLPVYIDKLAYNSDGIIVINRVKPHTAFRGEIESGLCKMLVIGLGKQKGAESCHALGFKYMEENIIKMTDVILNKAPILFAIGTVENAYDNIMKIEVVKKDNLVETDKRLLKLAKENMAKIYFDEIDVLIIDRIGKDISGDGMDPNITGRYPTPYAYGGPSVSKMVVLDLTEHTYGNANGMGTADFATRKLADKINFEATYVNGLTSTVVTPTHLPTILENDMDAIKAAIKTCNAFDITKAKIVRIKDTLHLNEIYISESLLPEAEKNKNIEILSNLTEMPFDSNGNLETFDL
ncbi:MAG: lactate racemase domain-containing protein [Deferribacterota bacterium]|nr:lactate racemase domain-containing protein [Deferribacterota bacterium]